MKEEADSLAAYLRGYWDIPLGTACPPRASPKAILPSDVVRGALDSGDLRLVRALPLWLSLLPKVDPPPAGWRVEDRRRLAYLCELAQALASLRSSGRSRPDASWAASVAGIQPEPWGVRVPLCHSQGPVATPSLFGELWGIEEPMTFPEYVAFQDQLLALKRVEGGHAQKPELICQDLLKLIRRFDDLAKGREPRPLLYLIGAGALVLEGLISRYTTDLDFICDGEGKLFENQVLPTGVHSHRVRSGLACMPAGWRERSREILDLGTRHIRVLIPDIHDRVVDKVARGLATDWQDVAAVLEAPPLGFSGAALAERARTLIREPTSTVFEAAEFRAGFDRLRALAAERKVIVPPLED